jgi:hypothetical protein
MSNPRVPRAFPGAALAMAAALLMSSACSSKTALPPDAWDGIIHVNVVLHSTTREQMLEALGQPVEASFANGEETLVWTNSKGYIVMLSAEGAPPNVGHYQSRIEARLSGEVVSWLATR